MLIPTAWAVGIVEKATPITLHIRRVIRSRGLVFRFRVWVICVGFIIFFSLEFSYF